ncbi:MULTISPECIES: ABC transporter substrate-binding protein [unclassified Paludibacterium]|uniref:substrate-binding periplasmic protein n=1 Tax=unclassified Paludibacterium TaxID=2618429 RepID=UPI001C042461|nr:transporter substrate-binding domain-containing protein [Paludibacterium sp. B53371]BEV71824.1 transporter substrate-binding domain-containing protein [Paludibacterium sp. THUN1379]
MRRCAGCWLLLWSLLGPCASAVTLIGAEVPPFVTQQGGLAVAILREAARRAGTDDHVTVYPFIRAMVLATQPGGPYLLVPPGRTPARESRYQWVAPLMDEAFVLVGNRKVNPNPPSRSAMTGQLIGVMRNSVGQELASHIPQSRLSVVTYETTNAAMLANGHIGAWAVAWNTALQAQREAGLPVEDLLKGEVLMRSTLYLAASLDMSASEVQRWRSILDNMRKDGTIARLEHDYRYVLP